MPCLPLQAAQPALLYIVPGVLGATFAHACESGYCRLVVERPCSTVHDIHNS